LFAILFYFWNNIKDTKMNLDQVMTELEKFGSEQTKKVLTRHGAQEPFFGVKVARC
jgi:hypothetical protein